MDKKIIFVTGGSGFIGTNLIDMLLKKNFIVHNIDKFNYCSVPRRFANFNNKKYHYHKINLKNNAKVTQLLIKYNPYYIFNLAADSHVDRSIDSPRPFFLNNVEATLNLLESIRNAKKKLKIKKIIHISTDEVYGGEVFLPSKEEDKYETNSPYSASKASTDHLCRAYWKTFKIPISIVNCCNNFGPYQFPEKFIPTIINSIKMKKKIPIYGDGKNIREWIFVKDFCEAIICVAKKGEVGERYNIGSNIRITNKAIVFKIIKEFQKSLKIKLSNNLVKFVKDRPGHDFRYSINSNKIRSKLKWKPKVNFEKGLSETVSWYLQNIKWLNYCKTIYNGKRLGN
tara:strand:- start:4627 stop:5649 length:1023 start_codon:yes stop_codon:yes gene_type:complete